MKILLMLFVVVNTVIVFFGSRELILKYFELKDNYAIIPAGIISYFSFMMISLTHKKGYQEGSKKQSPPEALQS